MEASQIYSVPHIKTPQNSQPPDRDLNQGKGSTIVIPLTQHPESVFGYSKTPCTVGLAIAAHRYPVDEAGGRVGLLAASLTADGHPDRIVLGFPFLLKLPEAGNVLGTLEICCVLLTNPTKPGVLALLGDF